MMTELEFKSLAGQGFNRIPLMSEALADLETPLSLYLKLTSGAGASSGGRYSFLLESVIGGERFGRYSFIGLPARTIVRASGFGDAARTEVVTDGQVLETLGGNPLEVIDAYRQRFKVALSPGLPRFCGGLAGYFGYDVVRHIEKKLENTCPPDALGTPDILLMHCEEVTVIDNLSGKLYLIVYADPAQPEAYAKAKKRLKGLREQLRYSVAAPQLKPSQNHPAERSFAKADYLAAVERAKGLIEAGDFMQVQVGQRISKRYTESPLSLYRAVRSLNPSPYMIYYDFGDFHVVSASPEILVRIENVPEDAPSAAGPSQGASAPSGGSKPRAAASVGARKVTIRPLAGTRPRGATPEADKATEQELVNDPKERAEHVMLIDLARNDIGRIAQTGSVKVTEAFAVERYSHVMHIVSNVEGILKDGMTAMDVLKATFPAGTLTGAPKVHAMELIDQLEPVKRGIYGGACGYISYAGDMDVAIAIRTGIIKDQMLHVQAAAGVVADSVPEMEWRETEHKARALLRAAELVEEGLE
ncbi:anthranilate synthase component I family protein [Ottowia sp.]|uniref:anthranilate synthase component I family protein n=1 Tax=Ottowia sp. TaxID=1898956 RepID=UPI003A87EB02